MNSVFRPLLRGDDHGDRLDRAIGELARALGEARDLDVLLEASTTSASPLP